MSRFLEVNNVSKAFKVSNRTKGLPGMVANMIHPKYDIKQAVKEVSFQIDQGEMVGFIGPNGAGKSTTIKMLSGILHPDSGEISVNGYIPYKHRSQYVSDIGVVFGQKSQLQWDLPVMDTFELLRYVYRVPKNEFKKNLNKYVDLLDLSGFINQPVRQLSLGQRMRADIVASLLHSPKIVFFDEPTIGVDVLGKEVIRNFVKELNTSSNMTMIFTTHDMQDIEKTCKRLLIIDKGEKLYDGHFTGIREKYGTQRQLDVEFGNLDTVETIERVSMEVPDELEPQKKRFVFESQDVQVKDVMNHLFAKYDVKDMTISEPEIENIIGKIYKGEKELCT